MAKRAIPLLYHDVIGISNNNDYSGFSGTDAAEYKLSVKEFEDHLYAIEQALRGPVVNVLNLDEQDTPVSPPVLLTFDDGGVSSYEYIAPMLEQRGWRGLFFISTDYIDKPAFLSSDQIRELHQRGHAMGSHSCSHPLKISDCTHEQLLDEWRRSLKVLKGIIGEPVYAASIPGGFYSREIAETAAISGVRQLFTSEPVQKIQKIQNCAVIGRFSVKRGDGAIVPVEFVMSNRRRRFWQYTYWNLKKLAKVVAGPLYARLRTFFLSRR